MIKFSAASHHLCSQSVIFTDGTTSKGFVLLGPADLCARVTSRLLNRIDLLCSPISSHLPVSLRTLRSLHCPFSSPKLNLFYCYFLLASLFWGCPLCFCYFPISLFKVMLLYSVLNIFFSMPITTQYMLSYAIL